MTWFVFSLVALVCWSGSDLFSKIGTRQNDKNSHWKVVFAVGLIMGIHFVITLVGGAVIDDPDKVPKFIASLLYTDFTIKDFFVYVPIAFIYILAMVFGYVGLRYIELSLSSPICNSSGSLALVICAIIWFGDIILDIPSIIGVALVSIGIIALGIVQYTEDDEVRRIRQEKSHKKYTKSLIALILPIIYLIIDALGTVGDQYLSYLSEEGKVEISDYASNSAFELTFVLFAVFSFCWLKFKKHDTVFGKDNKAVYIGGICETIGQVFYMAVMFDTSSGAEVGMVIISAYCALSVLWSRIFLKEKLSWKHYLSIAVTFAGIMLLGIFSEV
jgi:drug/metabolite transporter (DMT)-like permease